MPKPAKKLRPTVESESVLKVTIPPPEVERFLEKLKKLLGVEELPFPPTRPDPDRLRVAGSKAGQVADELSAPALELLLSQEGWPHKPGGGGGS